jgi:hypothetical protein
VRVGARPLTAKEFWEYVTRTLTNLPDERAAKIDNLDKTVSSVAGDVWAYPTRDLTRTQFPFWSAIITQAASNVSIAAGSSGTVLIQPPAGETWLIWLDFHFLDYTSGDYIIYKSYDGTTYYDQNRFQTGGSYGDMLPHLGLLKVLTNSLYAAMAVSNASTASHYFYYGYSGFKLSQPLWTPKPVSPMPALPWKRKTDLVLPSAIADLDKYKAEVLGVDPNKPNEYGLAVILEEDTPLAVDPNTGFPVERFTAYVKADVLADYIAKFKAKTADPVLTGYRKYLDKWKVEGIDFGV